MEIQDEDRQEGKSPFAYLRPQLKSPQACYKNLEAYSSFEGMLTDPTNPKDEPPSGDGSDVPKVNHVKDGEMSRYLYDQQVTNVVVTGLATDYW